MKKNPLDQNLPTHKWQERMENGDDVFTQENLQAAEQALHAYTAALQQLDNPVDGEIRELVKQVVLRFNALNEEYDYYIETLEREELCEYILTAAQAAGMASEEDITEEWREW